MIFISLEQPSPVLLFWRNSTFLVFKWKNILKFMYCSLCQNVAAIEDWTASVCYIAIVLKLKGFSAVYHKYNFRDNFNYFSFISKLLGKAKCRVFFPKEITFVYCWSELRCLGAVADGSRIRARHGNPWLTWHTLAGAAKSCMAYWTQSHTHQCPCDCSSPGSSLKGHWLWASLLSPASSCLHCFFSSYMPLSI